MYEFLLRVVGHRFSGDHGPCINEAPLQERCLESRVAEVFSEEVVDGFYVSSEHSCEENEF